MRILFFVSSLNAGGAERVATTLANAWARRGDEVTLVPTYLTKQPSFYPLDDAVRLQWLADRPGSSLSRWLPGLGKWLQMRRLIRQLRPDVIVSFLTNVNVNVLIASAGLAVPVIVSERTNPAHSQNTGRILRFLRRWSYRRARIVVMQTQASVQPFRALVPSVSDIAVVPNPLPAELSAMSAHTGRDAGTDMLPQQPGQDGLRGGELVAMGRMVAIKQFDVLIDAFAQLAPRHPAWTLTIWGDGPLRDSLAAQVDRLGLNGRIVLAGRTSRPWEALSRADLFVMTSRVEGFPNVLLEAMALALPCVALDCPSGPAELSRDGQDARLIPLDAPHALVGALDELMSDTGLRQQLGTQAAVSVKQRYGLPAILAQWDAIFERVTPT